MNLIPFHTDRGQVVRDRRANLPDLRKLETFLVHEFDGAVRATQAEFRACRIAFYGMDVRW